MSKCQVKHDIAHLEIIYNRFIKTLKNNKNTV